MSGTRNRLATRPIILASSCLGGRGAAAFGLLGLRALLGLRTLLRLLALRGLLALRLLLGLAAGRGRRAALLLRRLRLRRALGALARGLRGRVGAGRAEGRDRLLGLRARGGDRGLAAGG